MHFGLRLCNYLNNRWEAKLHGCGKISPDRIVRERQKLISIMVHIVKEGLKRLRLNKAKREIIIG